MRRTSERTMITLKIIYNDSGTTAGVHYFYGVTYIVNSQNRARSELLGKCVTGNKGIDA